MAVLLFLELVFLPRATSSNDALAPPKSDRGSRESNPVHPAERLHGQLVGQREVNHERKVNRSLAYYGAALHNG